jgi:hypothetical protein
MCCAPIHSAIDIFPATIGDAGKSRHQAVVVTSTAVLTD